MTPYLAARALVAVRARGVCSVPRELFSFSMILQLLTACSTIVLPPAPLIIVGPGCQSTQLLTAKLAAAAGHRVQVVTRTADVRNSNRLMYGSAELPESPPLFSCQNSQIASALGAAEGMVGARYGAGTHDSTDGGVASSVAVAWVRGRARAPSAEVRVDERCAALRASMESPARTDTPSVCRSYSLAHCCEGVG